MPHTKHYQHNTSACQPRTYPPSEGGEPPAPPPEETCCHIWETEDSMEMPIIGNWWTCGQERDDCEAQAKALCAAARWSYWHCEFLDDRDDTWQYAGQDVAGDCEALGDWELDPSWPGIEGCSDHCE